MRIKVIDKSSGQQGTIPDNEFDAKKYTKIEESPSLPPITTTLGSMPELGPNNLIRQQEEVRKKQAEDSALESKIFQNTIGLAGQVGGGILGTAIGGPVGGVIGAGLGGSLGEGARQVQAGEDISAGKIVKEGAMGAGGELLGLGIAKYGPKLLGKAGETISKSTGKLKNTINKEAVQGITKATPSQFAKLAEQGIDLNEVIAKHYPKGTSIDDVIGDIAKKGKGGIFNTKLNDAEKIIQETVKASSNIKIPVDDIVSQLNKEAKLLAKVPGNEAQIQSLNQFAQNTKKLYKNGLTPKQLLNIKRSADSKFGKAVIDSKTGSVAAQGQKTLANWSRKQLKTLFPEIANQLDTQSEILSVRPLLQKSRAITQTQGSTIRKGAAAAVDITKPLGIPGAVVDTVMGDPKRASRFLNVAGNQVPKTALTLPPIIAGAVPAMTQTAISGIRGGQQETNLPEITTDKTSIESIPQSEPTTQPTPTNYITGYPPEKLYQAYQEASLNGDTKSASKLRQMWTDETKYQKDNAGGGGKMTAGQKKELSDFDVSSKLMTNLIPEIEAASNKGIIGPISGRVRKINPYDTDVQTFNSNIKAIAQNVGRAMEGGVLRKEDIPKYEAMLPNITDTKEIALGKINNVVRMLELQMKTKQNLYSNSPTLPDTSVVSTDTLPDIEY